MIYSVIRENLGLYGADRDIFSLVVAHRHIGLNRNSDNALVGKAHLLVLVYHFKCSLYVLVMFCEKCDDSQITEHLNMPTATSQPAGRDNNNNGGA